MKALKGIFALALAAVLLIGGIAVYAAPSQTVTAVNDSFLPLSSAYTPTRIGGDYFVPYAVFGSGGLGVRYSYDSGEQKLVLSVGNRSLTFLIAQGYVHDQNMKTYDTPAYALNGQIYVPVRTVCSFFGLSYSLITSSSAQILRICSDTVLSDSGFLSANQEKLADLISGAGASGTAPGAAAGNGNAPENVPEEKHKPSTVYLAFYNAPGAHTREVLDTLEEFGRAATFFIGEEAGDAGLLRRIVGEGHAVGIALNASTVAPEALVETANRINARLLEETGMTTRIVSPYAGSGALTAGQLEALIAAGYRLWDTTLDSRDDALSAYRAAQTVTTEFARIDDPSAVRFRDREATAGALRTVLAYMRTEGIPSSVISVLRTPMNERNELR